eukprot:gnl/TRDRNA2_/TRDRNA2_33532_c0_seq2.p1 gnl/TRDRNA2_/TRDRNA2_33532_c0~~gnl/TRDRNA2_/TRDRNA2_33532_c0_seq2.p1  ORF type:complete len:212 (+),score=31.85 gnl/TRDRNA2_/TRDRNA2_33532_c0_seq2:729-1364(+)
MAAQAQVPFFYCSGSEIDELYIGLGAKRLRELFEKASLVAPSIIFIDEIDAVGRKRASGPLVRAHEYQALNQLLTCMDGIDTSDNSVVVIGATNRLVDLDPALVRAGRFDRIVLVDTPDEHGREAILRVHTRKLKLGSSVDLRAIAMVTPKYSGAALSALANEAAIRAKRRSSKELSQDDFLTAVSVLNATHRLFDVKSAGSTDVRTSQPD